MDRPSRRAPPPLTVWTTKGELVARGDVAVREDKKDCWYEMDVAPNMDASLLVCAAIIRALLTDEIKAKFSRGAVNLGGMGAAA